MKEICTKDAVGSVLCHDITQIIKDEKKGVLFKKGHVIREEDIPKLAHYADKEANPLYPVPVLMNARELENFYYGLMEIVPDPQ